jgi:HAD superfamily hydrolase (TIGR01549 family)
MIEAVVVDLDDTLCLTEAACFEMENEILVRMGREPMSRDIHVTTWGKPLHDAILERSPGVDLDEFKKLYAPTINEYTQAGKLDAIPQENLEALDQLIALGKLIMILTSRTHEELQHLLEPDHLLAERVKAFYYRDNMQFHKPDPRAFDELLRDHNLSTANAVYIGDSVSDAVAAKEAGLHFVASIESGLRTRDDFAHLPVDAFIDTFPQVVEVVQELDKAA